MYILKILYENLNLAILFKKDNMSVIYIYFFYFSEIDEQNIKMKTDQVFI